MFSKPSFLLDVIPLDKRILIYTEKGYGSYAVLENLRALFGTEVLHDSTGLLQDFKYYNIYSTPFSNVARVLNYCSGYKQTPEFAAQLDEHNNFFQDIQNKALQTFTSKAEQQYGARKLLPHQVEALDLIIRDPNKILAHDLGLGKTTTALTAAHLLGLPIHVICPKTLIDVWLNESFILDVKLRCILSYGTIPLPGPTDPFILLLDEAHLLQSTETARTKKVFEYALNAGFVLPITGTPMKNGNPLNLYPLLKLVKSQIASSFFGYKKTFGRSYVTRQGKRLYYNLDGLWHSTRDTILHKTKEECLNLPPKIRILKQAEVTKEASQTYANVYNELREEFLRQKAENKILSRVEKLTIFSQLRHASSIAKLFEAKKIGEELYEEKHPVVFFTSFVDTASTLHELLKTIGKSGLLIGATSSEQRSKIVSDFQNGDLDFIVSTFGVGGLGITLTKANHVVLIDRPWTPGDAIQAEDRCHRIGTTQTVTSFWLQGNKTDIKIDNLLLSKSANISTTLTGDEEELLIRFDARDSIDELFDDIFND